MATPHANAAQAVMAAFPWLAQIGIDIRSLQGWLVAGYEGESLVAMIRQTSQWQTRFGGLRRPDGTLRMSEGEYMSREDEYRKVLSKWGIDTSLYKDPASLHSFFEGEIDPNELNQRLEVYDGIRRGGSAIREAFYVYAGMQVTDDDLYEATVDPGKAEQMTTLYNQQTTRQPLDYATWITRATEMGLDRVVRNLEDLKRQGVNSDTAMDRIRQVNPDFARQMMDVLLHGGNPDGQVLALSELLHSFEYAMIGSAATSNGFVLPTKERIEQIRLAGVQRAQALEAYGQFATQRNQLEGALQRAKRNNGRFSQDDWERAIFLKDGDITGALEQAVAHEEALGKGSGGAQFGQDEAGRIQQLGLRPAFA